MQYDKLKTCVDTGRMQLKFREKVQHYPIVIGFTALSLLGVYFIISAENAGQQERSLYVFFICSSVALVFYFIQYRRLRFVVLETELSQDEIAEVIDRVAETLKWQKVIKGRNYYTATTSACLQGSWGEQITILLPQKKMYINSICDLKKNPSVTAWGRNKKNVDAFKLELRKAENLK